MVDPTVQDVFNLLDKLRHQHGYRLESAAAPFFTLFLSCVLEEICKIKVQSPIIPEFPIRKNKDNGQSYKADYFALSSDKKYAFLIELKTDMGSLDPIQDRYLCEAHKKGVYKLLCDVKHLAKAKNDKLARKKYFHILKDLECLNLIEMCPELEGLMYNERSTGVRRLIDKIRIFGSDCNLRVIYILPRKSPTKAGGKRVIDFCEFASTVEQRGEMGKRFAESLRRWVEQPAGSCKPDACEKETWRLTRHAGP